MRFYPIQDGLFQGSSRMMGGEGVVEGQKGCRSLKSVPHILQWWNFAVIPYLKMIQKLYESGDTPLEFCWHQQFFTTNQQILLYQEMHVWIAFWYKISYYFNFSRVFKDWFNKKCYNFDDVSKNGYPRLS